MNTPTSRGETDPSAAPDPREQQLAEAVAAYHDLRARDESVDIESFCGRYPDLAPELRSQLAVLDEVETLLESSPQQAASGKPAAPVPERLSGHKILGEIRSGGMGRVLLAMDERLGRKVAIKTLNDRYATNAAVRNRFMQEARAMARLSHPRVARIYELGEPDEIPHFVMEYVEGKELIEASSALTLQQQVELVVKIVWAVEFLHQHHLIHRDLKPGNILVGADLEPKLLDFGLAQQVDDLGSRLTRSGEVLGTPDYFSPEQARAEAELGARSDIFSLGTLLYQLLTGVVPFRADSLQEQIRRICESDPVLPRRINAAIPGDLQDVCMKALEKKPAERYASAREMAEDLERFLAGEKVLANPASYSRLMSGKIELHLRELKGWQQDNILSQYELDSFRKLYDRLIEREDAWIMEVRRLSLSQVTLYLGAWMLVVAALLVLFFPYPNLSATPKVLIEGAATGLTAFIGIHCWKQGRLRIAIAYLLAFCFLLPTTMLVAMKEWGLFAHFSQGKESLEFFARFGSSGSESSPKGAAYQRITNAQVWWSLLLSLPVYFWLRRFTQASVFSLVLAVMSALLSLVTLLRLGLLEWIELDPGRVYFRLIPFAILFFLAAHLVERLRCPQDSRYFYPVGILFTFVALSGVAAFHEPYARWLESVLPKTRGQIEYLFIANAGVYLALQTFCEKFGSPQMRWVSKWFRFVIPGHVLTSLLLLGIAASDRWHGSLLDADLRWEARFFELLLPAAACVFVFGSVPKQMKNFFVTGLVFLAVGVVRLQDDLFRHQASWPMSLLVTGILLMVIAANYTPIKLAIARRFRRKS